MLMIAAVLILGDFIIGPILANGKESTLALALSVAYPLLDLVLLFALMELVYIRQSSLDRGSASMLIAAVTLFIVSDVYFAFQNIANTYLSGGLVDTGYIVSYSLIGLAGILQANKWKLTPESISKKPRYEQSTWAHYLPYIGVGAAYLLLFWNQSHILPIDLSVTTLSVGGIIGLVLTRQIMAFNENSSLYIAAKKEIDERKQLEEDLKTERDRAENYLNIAEVILVALDTHARITLLNRRGYEILGYEEGELIGKDWINIFLRPEDYGRFMDFNNKIIDGKIKLLDYYESYILTRKGEERNIAWHTAVLKNDEGRIIGTLSSGEDITERKRAEEALRKAHDELEIRVKERTTELEARNAEMERFIYTVSHELRTPLISIGGFLGFVEQDAQNNDLDRLKKDIRIVNKSVSQMDRLLLGTLELSRIGQVVDPTEDVPFGEIVDASLRQTGSKIEPKGCKVSVAQNLPVVHVDRMRIAEVLVNLIENSLKYMGLQANPEIEIGQRIDGKDRIFFVRDNGIGIDPSQHNKVFELFYKVEKKSEGTGAGLTIVKRIIEVHGGGIWIETELGKGCTVCFTLPLADVG